MACLSCAAPAFEKHSVTSRPITVRVPDIHKGDMIYLSKPPAVGEVEIDGKTYSDYGKGDYRVESVKPSRHNQSLLRNPTTISARIVTK